MLPVTNPEDTAGRSTAQLFASAMAAFRAGKVESAIDCWEQLLAASPRHLNALQLLAAAYCQQSRWADAEECFRRALEVRPDIPDLRFNLAKVCASQGRWADAAEWNRQGLTAKPDDVAGIDHLGVCLRELGRWAEAEAAHRRCIALAPEYAPATNNLGIVRAMSGHATEAAEWFRQAARLDPSLAEAHGNLGNVLRETHSFTEAHAAYQQALAVRPDYPMAWTGLLFNTLYDPAFPQSERFRLHREWAGLLSARVERVAPAPRAARTSRIRVGYVSSDLYQHSIAYFLTPLLRHHDRSRFEISVFSNSDRNDAMTDLLRRHSDHWHPIFGRPEADAAALVARSEIDILVDLNGHSGLTNLGVFARKPAPIQITYLGYPDTSGLKEIDYRLTDELADPPGEQDEFFTERLWRLPAPAWCYDPPAAAPEPTSGEKPAGSPIVFGCFNNSTKLNPVLLQWWTEILARVPASRLKLKAKAFADPRFRAKVAGFFQERGVDASRLEVSPWIGDSQKHMAEYLTMDIALDTFPYGGTTTTCEALWMGVPVISLVGREHRSRVGLSLLSAVDLREHVAGSPEEYIAKAIGLALDPGRLNALKSGLRERLRASPLLDGRRFTANLERAYAEMFTRHGSLLERSAIRNV